MTTQDIKENLDKPRLWYIVLTKPHNEQKIKTTLEKQGLITYLPLTPVCRQWAGHTKEIHIPVVARCVFIYASNEEITTLQGQYPIFQSEVITG